jgi:hypothetical protein
VSALTNTLHFSHLLSYCQKVLLRAGKTTSHVYRLLPLPIGKYHLHRAATPEATITTTVKHSASVQQSSVFALDQAQICLVVMLMLQDVERICTQSH